MSMAPVVTVKLVCRPRRERKQVSYTYDAYDEQIRSALRGPARDERRSARFMDPRCVAALLPGLPCLIDGSSVRPQPRRVVAVHALFPHS